jgi:hypothetical protein
MLLTGIKGLCCCLLPPPCLSCNMGTVVYTDYGPVTSSYRVGS